MLLHLPGSTHSVWDEVLKSSKLSRGRPTYTLRGVVVEGCQGRHGLCEMMEMALTCLTLLPAPRMGLQHRLG
jgi:hypothetical protein